MSTTLVALGMMATALGSVACSALLGDFAISDGGGSSANTSSAEEAAADTSSAKAAAADAFSPEEAAAEAPADATTAQGTDVAAPSDAGPGPCSAGSKQCLANGVQTCGANGIWGAAALCVNSACVTGQCRGVCSPGSTQCSGGTGVETCAAGGTWGAVTACAGGFCNATGSCGVCAAASTRCVGPTAMQTCAADGQWLAQQACIQQTCVESQCTGMCSPNTAQCSDNSNVETCTEAGAWSGPTLCGGGYCNAGNCGYCPAMGVVAVSSSAIPLTGSPGNVSAIGSGGYAYVAGDWLKGGASTSCLSAGALCAAGTTGVSDCTLVSKCTWGINLGVTLNQAPGGSPAPYKPSGAGVTYALSNIPSQGLYIHVIADTGTHYYYPIGASAATRGTAPWTNFNTTPWLPSTTTYLTGAPTIETVDFQVNATSAATPYNLCVTSLSL